MKNPVKKLLAVALCVGASGVALAEPRALASGAPACGNTMGKTARNSAEKELGYAREQLASALGRVHEAQLAIATLPRELATGSPACGNTMGKSVKRECAPSELEQRMQVVTDAVIEATRWKKEVAEKAKAFVQVAVK